MPRFVLLRHECPPAGEKPSHWDFMLEADGVLWTWELRELPATWARALGCESASRPGLDMASDSDTVPAARLADHRFAYLDYEGPVSGGRGSVTRVDWGGFEWYERSPEQLEVVLLGDLLRGQVTIVGGQLAVVRCP